MSNDNGERIVPDKPGWWWIEADPEITRDEKPVQIIQVTQGRGVLLVSGTMPNRVDQRPDIVWLAPIPGPAVCAALADCEAAELAWANEDLDDELLERAVTNAEARLYAAMRAERDGAA